MLTHDKSERKKRPTPRTLGDLSEDELMIVVTARVFGLEMVELIFHVAREVCDNNMTMDDARRIVDGEATAVRLREHLATAEGLQERYRLEAENVRRDYTVEEWPDVIGGDA